MRTLSEISHDCFYKMENYHQVTIDFVQEAEEFLGSLDISDQKEVHARIESIGALQYQIEITLEVFNPEFEQEISDLTDVVSHLEIATGKFEALIKQSK